MPLDEQTSRLKLKKPAQPNTLKHDVERLRDSLDVLDDKVCTRDPKTGKLSDDQIPDDVARLDPAAGSTIPPAQLPDVVPQMVPEANGDLKIKREHLPDEAVTNIHTVASEVLMLELDASLGDVARVTNSGKTFMLMGSTPVPAGGSQKTDRGDWKEQLSNPVTSVNGYTGDVIVANVRTDPYADITNDPMARSKGPNNNITELQSLSGPLTLGGDGTGDNDAVTMRQLKGAMGTSGGASMSGVMNNFIGAVEWFNGPTTGIPAGYMLADGSTPLRSEVPDIVAAMKNGALNVCPSTGGRTSDERWLVSDDPNRPAAHRSTFSWADGDENTGTKIRLPDLNGIQPGSIKHLFLSGASGATNEPSVAQVWNQSLPNIKTEVVRASGIHFGSSIYPTLTTGTGDGTFYQQRDVVDSVNDVGSVTSGQTVNRIMMDASKGNKTFGRAQAYQNDPGDVLDVTRHLGDVYPNHAVGYWIIRVNGSFTAADTRFDVIRSDATRPANGQLRYGGAVQSTYEINGVRDHTAAVVSAKRIGDKYSSAVLQANNEGQPPINFEIRTDGVTILPANSQGYSPVKSAGGIIEFQSEIYAEGGMHTNPGTGNGVRAAENNMIELNNAPSTIGQGGYVNWLQGMWYAERFQFGISRGGSDTISSVGLSLFAATGNKHWYFQAGDGRVNTTAGLLQLDTGSDRRKKHDIEPINGSQALANIEAMENVSFIYNNDKTNTVRRGFIAQQLEEIDPLYVQEHRDIESPDVKATTLSLNNGALLMDALAAIKVLAEKNRDLQAQIDELKAKP